ncbi:MAG: iron-sulfur cluster assembly scaffold protein [Syntrophales bacterium]
MEDEKIKEEILKILYDKIGRRYSEKVIDYGTAPRNNGTMSDPDGYAKFTGPCGDTVEIFLRVKNGKIEDIRYTTDGCMTSHAAVSAATEMAKGKSLRECLRISQSTILDHLGGLPESDQHCALLASTTLHKALRNYAVGKKRSSSHE